MRIWAAIGPEMVDVVADRASIANTRRIEELQVAAGENKRGIYFTAAEQAKGSRGGQANPIRERRELPFIVRGRQLQCERAARSRRTLGPEIATHPTGEVTADGESEAGTFRLSVVTGVDLHEWR